MRNVPLTRLTRLSSFRRIAAVAWPEPRDPHMYGSMEIRVEALEAWIAAERARTGERITVTHAVTRALAMVLDRHRDINGIVRFGTVWMRRDVDIFVQVAVEGEEGKAATADLSGVKLARADTLDVPSIARQLRERAARIRARQDPDFENTKSLLDRLPGFVLGPLLRFVEWLSWTANVSPRFIGSPADPFGSACVTNVGVFGLTKAWAPFFPLARCSMIVTLGAIEVRPVVEGDRIVPGRVLHVNGTFDHRLVDGLHAGLVAKELRQLLEEPERLAMG
ncbi:MAG: 2-oxo acid dehydrogenase subunit E2 [Pseudomonadota bacterium]|nr:2-oxo acid dehydrogenase subunit E2 [Pseudomonadota bacterium]